MPNMYFPLVSVIIPLYNSEKHIAETLRSIDAQSYAHIEVIIVDDGSTDRSYEIALAAKNDRSILLKQTNKGASAARNTALELAKGDFIQFIDADDLLSTNKIEEQVKALRNHPNKIAMCSTVHFHDGQLHTDEQPSTYEESFLFNDDDPVHFLINLLGGFSQYGSMIPVHAWLVPKQLIERAGKWNENLSMDDDGEFFCRVMLHADGMIKTDGLCYYRRSAVNTSLSSQTNLKSYESMLNAYILKKRHILGKTTSNPAKVAIYKMLMNLAVGSYVQYPQLSKRALAEVPNISVPGYVPSVGGKVSTWLAKHLGWRFVKKLQSYYHKSRPHSP